VRGFDYVLHWFSLVSNLGEWCSKRRYLANKGDKAGQSFIPISHLDSFKALNQQLQYAARSEEIRGFTLCQNGPRISHLFFADDTLLFCRASMGDLEVILCILEMYELASGQKLNREKTTVFFSKATKEERRMEMVEFLGVSEVREYEKYLGLPAVVGRNKKESLNYINERVE